MFRRNRNEVTQVSASGGSIAAGGDINGAITRVSTSTATAGEVTTKVTGNTAEITIPKGYTLIVNGKRIDY